MDLFGDEQEYEEADEVSSAPAAVNEEEFGHPRTSKFSIGHEQIEKRLLELYNSRRMPHGLVFAGPKGIGKATLAYRLARFLFKQGITDSNQDSLFGVPETTPPTTLEIPTTDGVFSRVMSGGHPDLLTIERLYDAGKDKYKNSVEVDEIRKVAPFLRKTAAEGGWRVVIVDDADTMNRSAQNALLKILEEPPSNVLLILVTHRAGALIPTIKSRTHTINFDSLTADTFKSLLERKGERLGNEELFTLQALSQGSFGKALDILESDGLAMTGRVLDLLENFPRHDLVAVHKFAEGFGNSEEGMDLFADITRSVFRKLAKSKAKGAPVAAFGVHKELMQKLLDRLPLQRILSIGDALDAHFQKLQTGNLDRRQGVITAFTLIS
jgi:DNA polymerase III subunit delta'